MATDRIITEIPRATVVMAIRTTGPDRFSLSFPLKRFAMKAGKFTLIVLDLPVKVRTIVFRLPINANFVRILIVSQMKPTNVTVLFLFFVLFLQPGFPKKACSQYSHPFDLQIADSKDITPGAARTELYFDNLKGKSIGIICNQTSKIGKVHLVDSLTHAGFKITAIFSPEHGFRGNAENGAEISDVTDKKTGIKIISLYGKKKQPAPEDFQGINLLIFDIQDIGVRCYTYISTLTMVMQSAAEQGIPLIVLDRPNPNGFYIDGPVLDTASCRSFVGLHPVPLVYGMTIGEYALMLNGEGWLNHDKHCDLTVVPISGYNHNMLVKLDCKPSPNLPNWQSIYLYPSLCLFEGTFISVGRGTDRPFQVIGHPNYMIGSYFFTPRSIPGVSEHPPYEGKGCYGLSLDGFAENAQRNPNHFNLEYLLSMHTFFKDSTDFFNSYFPKLAGNKKLEQQILEEKKEPEIRKSWSTDILNFRLIRKKYLLYPEKA
jgi:uncharacterized protein YbbC (DUF1343 family)